MDIETKAFGSEGAHNLEVKKAFEDFLAGFEAFKQSNDERLKGLEKRSADVLLDEKVDRINKALESQQRHLDGLLLDAARPALGGERKADPAAREKKHAFDSYIRSGATAGLFEVKAMSEGSNANGGYTVPLEIERTIDRVLGAASPIRGIATVRQIGGGTYRKPIVTSGAASGWTGETDAISSPTTTPTLAALDFPAMELYAMPAATQMLLDDSQVDIEQWLAEEVQTVFAEQEGAAFVNGTGSGQPKGFLKYTNVADASWSWGNIGYVVSGADGAFLDDEDAPADALLNLAYAPKQAYRANGRWVMNRKTESAIRKFKDGGGNYVWQPGTAAGQPATIFGYAVTEAEDMPDIASDSYSIAFGDFARGYLVAKGEAAALMARQQMIARGEAAARVHETARVKTETQIQTIIREVPRYVTASSDSQCVLPWGFVRLFDAAASGADLDAVRAAIAPGQPDDAASGITLSDLATLLTLNFGIARQNAGQLEQLEQAAAP